MFAAPIGCSLLRSIVILGSGEGVGGLQAGEMTRSLLVVHQWIVIGVREVLLHAFG